MVAVPRVERMHSLVLVHVGWYTLTFIGGCSVERLHGRHRSGAWMIARGAVSLQIRHTYKAYI